MGAVKNAIQRDGLDPTVLDLDSERSLDSQRPQTKADTNCAGPNSTKNQESDEYKTTPSIWSSRLGFPEDWQALPQNNGSMVPEFPVDEDEEMNSTQLPTVTPRDKEEAPPLNKDPTYVKYYRMLKMVSYYAVLYYYSGCGIRRLTLRFKTLLIIGTANGSSEECSSKR